MCFNEDEGLDPSNLRPGTRGPAAASAPVRSYSEIAAILTEREGVDISPQQVKQFCRRAERNLARALLADSSFPGESRR